MPGRKVCGGLRGSPGGKHARPQPRPAPWRGRRRGHVDADSPALGGSPRNPETLCSFYVPGSASQRQNDPRLFTPVPADSPHDDDGLCVPLSSAPEERGSAHRSAGSVYGREALRFELGLVLSSPSRGLLAPWSPCQAFGRRSCIPSPACWKVLLHHRLPPKPHVCQDTHAETPALTQTCEGPWGAQPGVRPHWETRSQ